MAEYYEPAPDIQAQAEENKLVRTALTKYPEPYLSGLKLNADIEINGLTLNTIDDNGVVWVVSDIDGWWTLPESEMPDLPRGWGDGSYGAIGRWATRNITLTGSILTQTPEQAPIARDALIEALSLVKTGGWLIVDEESDRRMAAYVRLSGRPMLASVSPRGRIDFSVGLVANDPIKYKWTGNTDGYIANTLTVGTEIVANSVPTGMYYGTTTITAEGNVAVPVVIELPFGLSIPDANTLPYISNDTTDQQITINTGTASDKKLELDTYNREILEVQYETYAISNVVGDGNTVTYTANSVAGISTGDLVSVIGVNPADYDVRDGIVSSVDSANNLITIESSETATYSSGGDLLVTLGVVNGRAKGNVLIDWIYLEPGDNEISAFYFPQDTEITILYRSGWLG